MSAPTLNDIQSDLHNLLHLTETYTSALIEVDREGIPPAVSNEIHRVEALVWIGRDLLRAIADNLEKVQQQPADDAKAMRVIGKQYDDALADWIAADVAASEAEEGSDAESALKKAASEAEAKHDHARDVLFQAVPTTTRGYAEKGKILLRVWNRAEGMNDERIKQLFRSMSGKGEWQQLGNVVGRVVDRLRPDVRGGA